MVNVPVHLVAAKYLKTHEKHNKRDGRLTTEGFTKRFSEHICIKNQEHGCVSIGSLVKR